MEEIMNDILGEVPEEPLEDEDQDNFNLSDFVLDTGFIPIVPVQQFINEVKDMDLFIGDLIPEQEDSVIEELEKRSNEGIDKIAGEKFNGSL